MTALLEDFATFARVHTETGDVDPAYPVLRELLAGLDEETAVARIVVYVACYNLPQAALTWDKIDTHRDLAHVQARMVCATERRGLRGADAMRRHLDSFAAYGDHFDGLVPFLRSGFTGNTREDWRTLQANLGLVWGNGRWAAYKTGEILKTVLDWPVTPTDAGHAWSTGPRLGLALLYPEARGLGNSPDDVLALDAMTDRLVRLTGHPVEQVETHLCDFHALVEGRYYLGHDIDQQGEQIATAAAVLDDRVLEALTVARIEAFGSLGLRTCVDRPRKTAYRDHGLLLMPKEMWP